MTAGSPLAFIHPDDPADSFPPVDQALFAPNGLLAVGGDLSVDRLMAAYRRGIFPWFSAGEPILWWSPDPRTVFFPDQIHISRRLERTLRQDRFRVTMNQAFARVVQACAEPRMGKDGETTGSWLLPEMQSAYVALHQRGHAYSIEVWDNGKLVGGLYGVVAGRVFSAESMFSRQPNASKVALAHLGQCCAFNEIRVIDAQVGSPHLYRMGAIDIPRPDFIGYLAVPPVDAMIE